MTFFDKLRQKTFDQLRRAAFKRIFKLAARILHVEWADVLPPHEYPHFVNQYRVHRFLGLEKSEVKSWVIVGAERGREVKTILRNYPNCKVTIFECSERYLTRLRKRFQNNSRVEVVGKAVSDSNGRVDFFENNLPGTGSLLKTGTLSQAVFGMEQAETFSVDTIRLDDYFHDQPIDVLQMDVQGAELKVLNGAKQVLRDTKVVFTEVSVLPDMYVGAVTMDELDKMLKEHGFLLMLLGTTKYLMGDACYIKSIYTVPVRNQG